MAFPFSLYTRYFLTKSLWFCSYERISMGEKKTSDHPDAVANIGVFIEGLY